MKKKKVVIIGVGAVGQNCAQSIANLGLIEELVLIDYFKDVAIGNAMDIEDGKMALRSDLKVYAGDYAECNDADIIIITAGAAQKPGQSRLDLINVNVKIMSGIIDQINKTDFKGIILIVSNPVDILTLLVAKKAKVGEKRVIGSGTFLDTLRLKRELMDILHVSANSIQAFIVGEHGDSSFFAYSCAYVGGIPLSKSHNLSLIEIEELENKVRERAHKIIKLKKNTSFAIGVAVSKLVQTIYNHDHQIFPISVNLKGMYNINFDIYASSPATVNLKDGVKIYKALDLDKREMLLLEKSIKTLKEIADSTLK